MQRMKKRNKYKRKQNKRIATVITASVLVAALGTVGVFHHMEPMETYAKESFTGTKQVVEGHGGTIQIESQENVYTKVNICLARLEGKTNG